jgi:hypothetical protein
MKVRELIEELSQLDPEMLVVLSSDGEGNSYSPVSGMSGDGLMYEAESTWSGEVHDPEEWAQENAFAEEYDDGEGGERDEEDDVDYACPGVPCVVIYPIN